MKVLHVITGLNNGGAEAALTRLVTKGTRDAHEVVSLVDEGYHGSQLRRAGIRVHSLHLKDLRKGVGNLLHLPSLIRHREADVVQTWMYHANLIGGLFTRLVSSTPVVWGIHCSAPSSERDSRSTRVAAWLCGRSSHLAPAKVVSCSHEAVSSHVRQGYDASKFVVVHNGVDCNELQPQAALRAQLRADLHIGSDEFVIGAVARWHVVKGHQFLLRALAELPPDPSRRWRLLLVGTGMDAENAELARLIARFGLRDRVCLLGPRRDIPQIMNAIDVLALPSLGEGFPNVVAEAMACGTPCVASDVGDTALIVGDCGWVTRAKDVPALRSAIEHARSEHQKTESWANRRDACRRRIEDRFSLETMIENYNTVWESVRERRPSVPRSALLHG